MSFVILNTESPAPNVRPHRTAREGEGQTQSGHKGSLWSINGRLFPLHLLSMRRETLLHNIQLKQAHLYYLERIWSHGCPHHLTGSLKWRKTTHRMTLPTPTGPELQLRRDRPRSCSVDGGWGLRGLWEAILPLWRSHLCEPGAWVESSDAEKTCTASGW